MKKTKLTLAQIQAQIRAQAPDGWKNSESKFPLAFMDKTPRAPRKEGVKNKQEEHDEQAAVVKYLKTFCPEVLVSAGLSGELRPLGDMGKFYGFIAKLKSRGLLTGALDLRLTWSPSRIIFIEMKKKKGGVVSDAQNIVANTLTKQGFTVYFLHGGVNELREIIAKENIPCLEKPA